MSDDQPLTFEQVQEVVEDVEATVLAEDKLAASRNDVVEGTCQRILRELEAEVER
jgi:hypothetical protein